MKNRLWLIGDFVATFLPLVIYVGMLSVGIYIVVHHQEFFCP